MKRSAAWCSVAAVLALSGPVLAQNTLSPGTVRSVSLSGAQQNEVESFVDRQLERLSSGEVSEVVAARDALSEPFGDRDVTVAFRQAFFEAGADRFRAMAEGEDVAESLLALFVASRAATDAAVMLIADHLDTELASSRVYALGRLEEAFRQSRRATPTIDRNTAMEVLVRVGELAAESDEPAV